MCTSRHMVTCMYSRRKYSTVYGVHGHPESRNYLSIIRTCSCTALIVFGTRVLSKHKQSQITLYVCVPNMTGKLKTHTVTYVSSLPWKSRMFVLKSSERSVVLLLQLEIVLTWHCNRMWVFECTKSGAYALTRLECEISLMLVRPYKVSVTLVARFSRKVYKQLFKGTNVEEQHSSYYLIHVTYTLSTCIG